MGEPELNFDPAEIEPFIDWRGIWLRKAGGKIEVVNGPGAHSNSGSSGRLAAFLDLLGMLKHENDGEYHLTLSSEYPYEASLTERFYNPGWISAADQLPEDGQEVLVWMNGRIQHCAYVEHSNSFRFLFGGPKGGLVVCDEVQDYDHWMPVPPPPKRQE